MADLYPTKTRLTLLEHVRAGHVLDLIDDTIDPDDLIPTWDTTGAEDGMKARRVTAAITGMVRAGWVTLGSDSMTWHLTDLGHAVLAGGGRECGQMYAVKLIPPTVAFCRNVLPCPRHPREVPDVS